MSAEFTTVRIILECVAATFDLTPIALRSARRSQALVEARAAACLLARDLTGQSYPQIGRVLGMRDHTTIMHAITIAERRCAADRAFAEKVAAVRVAVVTIARSELSRLLNDPDPVATAERLFDDPIREAARVSILETMAMAARLLTLEDLAGATFQLLSHLDELSVTPRGERREALRANVIALRRELSDLLTSLDFAVPIDEPPAAQGSLNHA